MSDVTLQSRRCIGLDLDNTLADYRHLFTQLAREAGVVQTASSSVDREALRAAVRASQGGESLWQSLQAAAYGPRMATALLFPGVADFLSTAHRLGYRLFIVSHRTLFAAADKGTPPTNLHETALAWLNRNGMIGEGALIRKEDVYFETSRPAKLARIASLTPEIFIDDLPEVLQDVDFPANTLPWRFAPTPEADWNALMCRLTSHARTP